jgi:CheY-like chemotaxis protein
LFRSQNDTFTVMAFDSGQSALDHISEAPPAVVFCDYQMDSMDGVAFTRAVRQSEATAHVPVFLITADESARVATMAESVGVTKVLHKPLHRTDAQIRARITIALARLREALATIERGTEQRAVAAIDAIINPTRLSPQSRGVIALACRLARALGVSHDLRVRIEYAVPLVRIADENWPESPDQLWSATVRRRLRSERLAIASLLDQADDPDLAAVAEVLRYQNRHDDTDGEQELRPAMDYPLEASIVDVAQRLNALMEPRPGRPPIPLPEVRERLAGFPPTRYPKILIDTLIEIMQPADPTSD